MALKEYLGAVVLEVDGQEVEIESYDVQRKTGRKLVKTMNKTGRPAGFAKGVAEIDIKVTAVIPATGDLDWDSIEGAKLTIYPITAGGQRTSYLDCFTLEVGEKYTVDGEAKRDLSMAALRKVVE
ncbi:phage tail protein [uncultured Aquitalea sp.]|uniref:phage tail protein n=1 Tax=uncultured Aquitalea sp. TaxID=540272 RepID=UPI0025D42BED|nr:phage tail protein [uncultured Aquitalea sp.]